MPSWVASAPRISSLAHGRAIERMPIGLRCRHAARLSVPHLRARSASTHVSPTAINLRPDIPQRNRELHEALSALEGAAAPYVSSSRLQLALQGLAAQDAVTRVAVLGLKSQAGAQRLVRLLLADPLGGEERWERELEKVGDGKRKAVLLKYGEEGDAQSPSPLYKVLPVPSRVLRAHNLELLVSTLDLHNIDSKLVPTFHPNPKDALLVPNLEASSGPVPLAPFPVHKTLVFGEGLDSAIAFGHFSTGNLEYLGKDDMVKLAIDLPAPAEEADASAHKFTSAVSLQAGTKAIATFRESIQNSIAYEHGWYKSGLPTISAWLTQDAESSEPIKPVVKSLITSILADTEVELINEESAELEELTAISPDNDTSLAISTHLETWAENSHTELRDELDKAFSSRNWHKLSWYKLFWRVDDVAMLAAEILERRWLVSAEKSSIYLAGRMNQAGYPDELQSTSVAVNSIPEVTTQETAPTATNPRLDLSTSLRKSMPWPSHIAAARTELINDIVPPLQALAQRLILQTLSTTSLSSALSALLYVSVSSFSVFEASAVGVLGLTISLRRMQKLWEGTRESWEASVREEGRAVLKRTEETAKWIVKEKDRVDRGVPSRVEEEEGERRREVVREKVERVREVLGRMEGKGKGV